MAILKKDQKQQIRNVLLRVSIPAPLMAEMKKTRKICTSNGFYFDIKPDVIGAVEKAVQEAKALVEIDKKSKDNNAEESEAQMTAQSSDFFSAAAPPEG